MTDEHEPDQAEPEKAEPEKPPEEDASAVKVTGKGCVKPKAEVTLAGNHVALHITDAGRRGWQMDVIIPNEALVDKPKPQKSAQHAKHKK